jgi:hypothetical protein
VRTRKSRTRPTRTHVARSNSGSRAEVLAEPRVVVPPEIDDATLARRTRGRTRRTRGSSIPAARAPTRPGDERLESREPRAGSWNARSGRDSRAGSGSDGVRLGARARRGRCCFGSGAIAIVRAPVS